MSSQKRALKPFFADTLVCPWLFIVQRQLLRRDIRNENPPAVAFLATHAIIRGQNC